MAISGWWQTVDKNCFLAWFQGTAQLPEGRDILTQCPSGLRPWEPPSLVSLWCSNRVWALFSCCTNVWSLGWVQVNAFVPGSQFIKILKKVVRVCLPYMNHFDFPLGWDVERTGRQGWTASRACSYGSKFLTLFLVLVIKNPPGNAEVIKRHGFNPWVRKIPWRRKWQPTPVFLPGKSHGQRSLVGYSPQDHKELDVTEAT